jgi:hypothetical protein
MKVKRMMKSHLKEIKLQAWEEIIGNCVEFEAKNARIVLILRVCGQNMRIAYPRDSTEGSILRKFGRKLVGQKLGILRTDIPAKLIVVRIIPKKKSANSETA